MLKNPLIHNIINEQTNAKGYFVAEAREIKLQNHRKGPIRICRLKKTLFKIIN
jgi:hypothetical protein